jgi:UDP-glucose 4-epimerase
VRVLVTGGAGYVGSVTTEALVAAGHETVVVDSFLKGHSGAVPPDATLVAGDSTDRELMEQTLRGHRVDAVVHCSARSLVGESMADPASYFRTNVAGGLNLLDAMRAAGVNRIVFSSSAATYGLAPSPITEDQPPRPVNPYGETKRQFEGALDWYARSYGMAAMSLRYFNVAGASENLGEDHDPETHLIPNMLKALLGGDPLKIFGTDYETPDGTCIRDYIHVVDLADAHMRALDMTADLAGQHVACNLGSGSGFSILEVLRAAEAVTGREVPHSFGPRREGDPAVLVASIEKAADVMGWRPQRGSLDEMIGSAWLWHQAHPRGYST